MAFSKEIPPYIFEHNNSGIEIDIITAALAHKGHTLKPVYFPLGRIPYAFSNKLVDAVMGDIGVNLKSQGGFYAKAAVIYDNVFITLKSSAISLKKPTDFDLLSVVSFQGAEKRYPKWLKKVKEQDRFYGVSDQLTQVKLLYFGRYDVVLSDRYIFRFFAKKLKLMHGLDVQEVVEHKLTIDKPMDYRPVFRDKNIRDDFNFGLNKVKESGEFERIYSKYISL
ncbi:ABC transporter substrate-binding protein [Colwellia hornerae]|uniref:ABC transporter substrate-binding protein n=2 Tax=Colwellia hornerae TaxID=89402 RepID=A0A5C6QNH6_9GAMM|nr:ABC transporter substrate-binding protein [Colwellia hornerae]TWX62203.1 ABC transporter substrate-binding protein [Colwellia hornerae]TWX70605.1 ABC transporter substrate-binding protein [Colwellia hornerae]